MASAAEGVTGKVLWLSFLNEWKEEALARGSKVERAYRKAHQSLSACPIEFQHPCQTTQLSGIGPTIATKLEERLQKWCHENDQPMPQRPGRPNKRPDDVANADDQESNQPAKKRAAPVKRAYIPQHRSGAYGLLIGLYARTVASGDAAVRVSKSDLIGAARPYSDTEYDNASASSSRPSAAVPMSSQRAGNSSAASGSRSFYTGWSSVKTLIAKGYIVQTGNPARYSLGDQGYKIAQTLALDAGLQDMPVSHQELGSVNTSNDEDDEDIQFEPQPLADVEPVVLPAGSYTIHLIVDNRERHRFGHRHEREPLAALLIDKGIDVEVRALEVGDAVWLARKINGSGSEHDEVVLDFIVERKRLDDLTSSILDGRWRDQKVRFSS